MLNSHPSLPKTLADVFGFPELRGNPCFLQHTPTIWCMLKDFPDHPLHDFVKSRAKRIDSR